MESREGHIVDIAASGQGTGKEPQPLLERPSETYLQTTSSSRDLDDRRSRNVRPPLARGISSHTSPGPVLPLLKKHRSASLLRFTTSASPSPTPSLTPSPETSRNASPTRREVHTTSLSSHVALQPSAAAIQRALSGVSIHRLPSGSGVSDAASRLPRAQRSATNSNVAGETSLRWPISPRLKSPPPTLSARRGSSMSQNSWVSAPQDDSTTLPSSNPSAVPTANENDEAPPYVLETHTSHAKSTPRNSNGKSTLETVEENTFDIQEPSPAATEAAAELKSTIVYPDEPCPAVKHTQMEHDRTIESGNESAGNRSDQKADNDHRTSSNALGASATLKAKAGGKSAYGTLTSAKARQAELKQGMTVETETVPSVPQSAINRSENSGSVRLKASNETIRPKKERKRVSHRARNLTQGAAITKADIFEARVASAVNAHSSDSDDTFVYESNPPEAQRTRRHHSRTPSVTSAHSVAEPRSSIRPFADPEDRKVAGKRSMKFSNHNDVERTDSKSGTVRSHRPRRLRTDRDSTRTLDRDTPFTHASKLRTTNSRPHSPRSPHSLHHGSSGGATNKSEQVFDFDGATADDERTPLITSGLRSARSGRGRRTHPHSTAIYEDPYEDDQLQKRWASLIRGVCLGLGVLVGAIVFAMAILVTWNRPLYDVKISRIENVLATQQELILDLCVGAVNPNMLSVTVSEMDLNIFAKSKHVGKSTSPIVASKKIRRQSPVRMPSLPPGHGVDHGTDPPDKGDLEKDTQTMLLGRAFKFDQSLSFDNSIFSRTRTYALGELSLMKPGNRTETGGSARWERVLQYPFELIVRGTLRYNLPISLRQESIAVEGSIVVHPEEGTDSAGNMRLGPVDRSEEWLWIEWQDVAHEEEIARSLA